MAAECIAQEGSRLLCDLSALQSGVDWIDLAIALTSAAVGVLATLLAVRSHVNEASRQRQLAAAGRLVTDAHAMVRMSHRDVVKAAGHLYALDASVRMLAIEMLPRGRPFIQELNEWIVRLYTDTEEIMTEVSAAESRGASDRINHEHPAIISLRDKKNIFVDYVTATLAVRRCRNRAALIREMEKLRGDWAWHAAQPRGWPREGWPRPYGAIAVDDGRTPWVRRSV